MSISRTPAGRNNNVNGGDHTNKAPQQGDIPKPHAKPIPNYLKPTVSSCHGSNCPHPRCQRQTTLKAAPAATSSAKPKTSINNKAARPLPSSMHQRTPSATSSREWTTRRTERPMTATISSKERTRRTDQRSSSVTAIAPKPGLEMKACKTPASGKELPLKKTKCLPKMIGTTSTTNAVEPEEDKVLQVKDLEAEVNKDKESENYSIVNDNKLKLQPESEAGDKTPAEEKEKGEQENVMSTKEEEEEEEETVNKLQAARRNKVKALAGVFESAIRHEHAAATVTSSNRPGGRGSGGNPHDEELQPEKGRSQVVEESQRRGEE